MTLRILVRGGGDLASGVVYRLHQSGWQVVITEIDQPLVVRRKVAFAEAVYQELTEVEGVSACRVENLAEIESVLAKGQIPVLVDAQAESRHYFHPEVLIDGRTLKRSSELGMEAAAFVIGLGPGFDAGKNCHAAIETRRGHHLGRVLWTGGTEPDTGVPDMVGRHGEERVLRAPCAGILESRVQIGEILEAGQAVARVGEKTVSAPFKGVVRGILHAGLAVTAGMKIGDLDPRCDPSLCYLVSDKALAVAGGVLEAILSRKDFRPNLWG